MVDTSLGGAVTAVAIVCTVGGVVWAIRSAVHKSDNETAKKLLKVSDTIVKIKFFGGIFLVLGFVLVLLLAGAIQR